MKKEKSSGVRFWVSHPISILGLLNTGFFLGISTIYIVLLFYTSLSSALYLTSFSLPLSSPTLSLTPQHYIPSALPHLAPLYPHILLHPPCPFHNPIVHTTMPPLPTVPLSHLTQSHCTLSTHWLTHWQYGTPWRSGCLGCTTHWLSGGVYMVLLLALICFPIWVKLKKCLSFWGLACLSIYPLNLKNAYLLG